MDTTLALAIAGPFAAIILVIGWIWNLIMVDAMIKNGIFPSRAVASIACIPWGLSLWFTGFGIALGVRYIRDFYRADDMPAMTGEEIERRLTRSLS